MDKWTIRDVQDKTEKQMVAALGRCISSLGREYGELLLGDSDGSRLCFSSGAIFFLTVEKYLVSTNYVYRRIR